jgi:hypothetical protein
MSNFNLQLGNAQARGANINSGQVNPQPTAYFDQALTWEQAHERELKTHRLAELRLLHRLRASFAERIFVLTCAWLFVVFAVVVCQGFRVTILGHKFELSTEVLISIVASTILPSLLAIILRYLFKDTEVSQATL